MGVATGDKEASTDLVGVALAGTGDDGACTCDDDVVPSLASTSGFTATYGTTNAACP